MSLRKRTSKTWNGHESNGCRCATENRLSVKSFFMKVFRVYRASTLELDLYVTRVCFCSFLKEASLRAADQAYLASLEQAQPDVQKVAGAVGSTSFRRYRTSANDRERRIAARKSKKSFCVIDCRKSVGPQIGASYCGKARPDLSLNQCHGNLTSCNKFACANIYFIEGRSAKQCQA